MIVGASESFRFKTDISSEALLVSARFNGVSGTAPPKAGQMIMFEFQAEAMDKAIAGLLGGPPDSFGPLLTEPPSVTEAKAIWARDSRIHS